MTAFFHQLSRLGVEAGVAFWACDTWLLIPKHRVSTQAARGLVQCIAVFLVFSAAVEVVQRYLPRKYHIFRRLTRLKRRRNSSGPVGALRTRVAHAPQVYSKVRLLARAANANGHQRSRSIFFEETIDRFQQKSLPATHHL